MFADVFMLLPEIQFELKPSENISSYQQERNVSKLAEAWTQGCGEGDEVVIAELCAAKEMLDYEQFLEETK